MNKQFFTLSACRTRHASPLSRNPLRRGSLTVEGAFVIPFTFMIMILIIILTFYIHNRVWYTCAACESALKGILTIPEAERQAAAETAARSRIDDQIMPGSRPELQVTSGTGGLSVCFSGLSPIMFTGELTPARAEGDASSVRPDQQLILLWTEKRISGQKP